MILRGAAITGEKNEHRVSHGDSGVNTKESGGVGTQAKSAVGRRVFNELLDPPFTACSNSSISGST